MPDRDRRRGEPLGQFGVRAGEQVGGNARRERLRQPGRCVPCFLQKPQRERVGLKLVRARKSKERCGERRTVDGLAFEFAGSVGETEKAAGEPPLLAPLVERMARFELRPLVREHRGKLPVAHVVAHRGAARRHAARVGAGAALLVGADHNIVADAVDPRRRGRALAPIGLVDAARESGHAATVVPFDERAYQFVAVALAAPKPAGWIVLGFAVDDALAAELRQLAALHVSFFGVRDGDARSISLRR